MPPILSGCMGTNEFIECGCLSSIEILWGEIRLAKISVGMKISDGIDQKDLYTEHFACLDSCIKQVMLESVSTLYLRIKGYDSLF